MPRRMPRSVAWQATLILACSGVTATGGEAPAVPPAWLTVRAVRPDVQADRVIALFRGSRAAHPAAALAAWKHATGGRGGPGKAVEAAIAALNPPMARELRSFDGAEVLAVAEPGTGRVGWRVVAPNDDGSLSAALTALALTDGAVVEPIGSQSVFRLGPPGSALAASRPGRLAIAPDRDALARLLDPARPAGPLFGHKDRSGWEFRIEPDRLGNLTAVEFRRASAALEALGCRELTGRAGLEGETVSVEVRTTLRGPAARPLALDPAWLDAVPPAGLAAVACLALEPDGAGIDRWFAVADRVEKADPAFAKTAPLRVRLNLLAAAARVRPDVDLWPSLRGLTAAYLVDTRGHTRGALVGLHTAAPESAVRIAREVLPRLAATYLKANVPVQKEADVSLGMLAGRPLRARAVGSSVWVAWGGGVLDEAVRANRQPTGEVVAALRPAWGNGIPQRTMAFWPGRLGQVVANGPALAAAFSGAPPVVWTGRTEGTIAVDALRWGDLASTVRRGLDALPLEPPPDRSPEVAPAEHHP